ncbi:hypothetical protein CVT24_005364 [Panaeolus cyanescens]|uniref:Uncharacterized protein n=1 Tax=Panaeolus cyanescens TaxID=181874 RepID=A0A409Y9D7_9AGAR|nr:hypothetical protein CVT24_005364 [Panaeolus cyanescens]
MSDTHLSNCANYADTNPDIAGVGVRVSFYLQTFLLVLLVDRSWESAPITLWTFIATSFGVVIAAVVQRREISLFQALHLSYLVWLANFAIFISLASYSRQREAQKASYKDFKVKYGAMIQTLFSMGLTIYIWQVSLGHGHAASPNLMHLRCVSRAVAPTFGNQSECSPFIKYVLFAIEVPALRAGRYIGLIFASLLTTLYILISCYDIWSSYKRHKPSLASSHILNEPNEPPPPEAIGTHFISNSPDIASQAVPPRFNAITAVTVETSVLTASSNHARHIHRRPRRRHWTGELDPMLVGIVIWQILIFTYFIVSSELFLKRNPTTSNGATQWGYGQILALIVVMPSALSVIDALGRYGFKRVSKRSDVVENATIAMGARHEPV